MMASYARVFVLSSLVNCSLSSCYQGSPPKKDIAIPLIIRNVAKSTGICQQSGSITNTYFQKLKIDTQITLTLISLKKSANCIIVRVWTKYDNVTVSFNRGDGTWQQANQAEIDEIWGTPSDLRQIYENGPNTDYILLNVNK